MSIHIQNITPEQTRSLRHLVLWPHIEKEADCVIAQDHDNDAFHLGAECDGNIIAIGSFFPMVTEKMKAENPYRLRAMASHPDYRGSGAAAKLILNSFDELRNRKCDLLWCDARLSAVNFYLKLGLEAIDQIYDVPKIGPHKFMYIHL